MKKNPSSRMCLRKPVQRKLTFRVDPAILGGLVIRVGDKVLDGSVAGKLEGLAPEPEITKRTEMEGFW